ncbi:MAG: hypothetical protein QXV17_14300, partial [Candidatus Micrarchaeaceae archaeon]
MTKKSIIIDLATRGFTKKQILTKLGYKKRSSYVNKILKEFGQKSHFTTNINVGYQRELFICDMHFPYEDKVALQTMLDFTGDRDINIVTLG